MVAVINTRHIENDYRGCKKCFLIVNTCKFGGEQLPPAFASLLLSLETFFALL